MPLYEYRCTSCGYKFEKIQKFSDAPERVCPKCQGELVRPVTAPALKFEGAGWYINDYAPKGGSAASGGETKDAAPSENKSAGESKTADSTAASSAPAAPATGSSAGSGGSGSSGSGSSGSGASGSGSSGSGSSTTAS